MTTDKGLGFIRNIKLVWLHAAADARIRTDNLESMRLDLDQHLESEIVGAESRRKTIDVLVAIWYRSMENNPNLFSQALDFVPRLPVDQRIWLHYGLTLLNYPFFRQTASIIGKLARTGEPVTRQTVKGRLAKEIGNLGSLSRASERIISSLVDWGALAHRGRGNTYLPQFQSYHTSNLSLQTWLLGCALSRHAVSSLAFPDLIRLPELFPFRLTISLDRLRSSGNFTVQRHGMWDMISTARR